MKKSGILWLLLGVALPAQAPGEKWETLDEGQAAGKVRWLLGRLDRGELRPREATQQVVGAFAHPWPFVRIVVLEEALPRRDLDQDVVTEALGAELVHVANELRARAAGKAVDPRDALCEFTCHYVARLLEVTAPRKDPKIAPGLQDLSQALDSKLLLAQWPALVEPLVQAVHRLLCTRGTAAGVDAAVTLFERMEAQWQAPQRKAAQAPAVERHTTAETTRMLGRMREDLVAAFGKAKVEPPGKSVRPAGPAWRALFDRSRVRFEAAPRPGAPAPGGPESRPGRR